jgi:peroxiredoxin
LVKSPGSCGGFLYLWMITKTFLFTLLLFVAGLVSAQQTIKTKEVGFRRIKVDSTLQVNDSLGNRLPYKKWKPLYDSGDYTFFLKNPDDSVHILKWLSPEKKQQMYQSAPPPRASVYFKTGEKIASFTAKDIYNNKISLEQFKGKIVVLTFWVTECGSVCIREMTELNGIVKDYSSFNDIVYLAVFTDDKSKVKEFLKPITFDYTIIPDGRDVQKIYGIAVTPTHVVIDKEGYIRFHSVGTSLKTGLYIRKTIDEILKISGSNF